MSTYYHGGIPGMNVGDDLVPSPPHVVDDGCPICVARREGRGLTVGEYRAWLQQQGPRAARVLAALDGVPDHEVIDPPSAKQAVYITTEQDYALWYAARTRGDLYRVEPVGPMDLSTEDRFESYTVPRARIVEVIERKVRLTRQQRRRLLREWGKRDRKGGAA